MAYWNDQLSFTLKDATAQKTHVTAYKAHIANWNTKVYDKYITSTDVSKKTLLGKTTFN